MKNQDERARRQELLLKHHPGDELLHLDYQDSQV